MVQTKSYCLLKLGYFLVFVVFLETFTKDEDAQLLRKRTFMLDSDYKIQWTVQHPWIEFRIEVETNGLVIFGLSPGGARARVNEGGADLVIISTLDGSYFIRDYHSAESRDGIPELDDSQNWQLDDAKEEAGSRIFRVSRLLNTCDRNDTQITEGTVNVLWGIVHQTDDDWKSNWNWNNIKSIPMNLRDPPALEIDLARYDSVDFSTVAEVSPELSTIQWSSLHKRPDATDKIETQVVAFIPYLRSAEALKHTHHFNVYSCQPLSMSTSMEYYGRPSTIGMDRIVRSGGNWSDSIEDGIQTSGYECEDNFYAWSLGGRALVLPEAAGLPWRKHDYFLLTIHLDNVDGNKAKFVTGVTLFYSQARQFEAEWLIVEHNMARSLLIPPATKDWTIVGHCDPACTSSTLPSTGIQLFNVNAHSHRSGTEMKLRHFRGRRELPPVLNDRSYDYTFQENRPLSSPVRLLPGDQLTIECTYDSRWQPSNARTPIVSGGSTADEMCMAFILYYPKTSLSVCSSQYPEEGLDIQIDWTDQAKTDMQAKLRYGQHETMCDFVPDWETSAVSYPKHMVEFQVKDTSCNIKSSSRVHFWSNTLLVVFILVIILVVVIAVLLRARKHGSKTCTSTSTVEYNRLETDEKLEL